MYDASAKFPSGILNGNINQLGDYNQCLDVVSDNFQGQYCLAGIQLSLPENNKYLNSLRNLMLSNEPYKSSLNDVRKVEKEIKVFVL